MVGPTHEAAKADLSIRRSRSADTFRVANEVDAHDPAAGDCESEDHARPTGLGPVDASGSGFRGVTLNHLVASTQKVD